MLLPRHVGKERTRGLFPGVLPQGCVHLSARSSLDRQEVLILPGLQKK